MYQVISGFPLLPKSTYAAPSHLVLWSKLYGDLLVDNMCNYVLFLLSRGFPLLLKVGAAYKMVSFSAPNQCELLSNLRD